MEQTTIQELSRVFREALGDAQESATARLRRLLPRLSRSEPELAAALAGVVHEGHARQELGTLRGKVFQQAPVDADSRQQLLIETYPVELPVTPLFNGPVRVALDRVVEEWRAAERLRAAGEHPIRSLLLSGPPGVGKTLSASWLAKTLDMPLLTLDLATVISSYLGKSGTNLRMVLDYAQTRQCVLLLDEFDAIAKRRDDDSDVGELKRLVTVLLQSIDQWLSHSLLVAATNHGDLLDSAIWRRFDLTLMFHLPALEDRQRFLQDRGVPDFLAQKLAPLLEGVSFSFLERLLRQARKEVLLKGISIEQSILQTCLPEVRPTGNMTNVARDMAILEQHMAGESSREIGAKLGVSHSTVNRALRSWLGESSG